MTAEHTDTEFTIPLENIVILTLLEELPRTKKVSGNGLPNLNAGTFRNSAEGKVKVLLNPRLDLRYLFVLRFSNLCCNLHV